jgi:hypothetical protein
MFFLNNYQICGIDDNYNTELPDTILVVTQGIERREVDGPAQSPPSLHTSLLTRQKMLFSKQCSSVFASKVKRGARKAL